MPKLRAFTLGFFLLGFELLVFRGLDIVFYKNFWLLMPVIMFGSALGSACGYFHKGKHAPDWWLAASIAGAGAFFYWCQVYIGTFWLAGGVITLAVLTTVAWGLSSVQTYSSMNILTVSALASLGGVLGSATPLLLNTLTYPQTVTIFLALAFALAAASAWGSRAAWLAAAGIAAVYLVGFDYIDPDRSTPAMAFYGNSYAQLKVQSLVGDEHGTYGGDRMLSPVTPDGPRIYAIYRNHAEATLILDAPDISKFPELKIEPSYALLDMAEKDDIAIIGSGGGQEIVQAQALGFKNILAVEINPLMVRASREHMRDPESGYGGKNVTTINQDARFYFRHLSKDKKFDVISISLVRNYGSVGLMTYAENYIFTREAFDDYLGHLKPNGLILIRSNASEFFNGSIYSALKSSAGGRGKIARVTMSLANHYLFRGHRTIVLVYNAGTFTLAQKKTLLSIDDSKRIAEIQKAPAPVAHDNQPYVSWWKSLPKGEANVVDFFIPVFCLAPLAFLSLLVLGGRALAPGNSHRFGYAVLSGLTYFGLQTIFLEKVTLLTGLPTGSLILVLNLFLVGGVFGAWLARERDLGARLPVILAALIVFSVAGYFGLRAIQDCAFTDAQFLGLAGVILFPATFCAGLSFSVFFRRSGEESPRTIPLILALNGVGSLMAGIESKGLAIAFGFNLALFTLLAFYAVMMWLSRPPVLNRS